MSEGDLADGADSTVPGDRLRGADNIHVLHVERALHEDVVDLQRRVVAALAVAREAGRLLGRRAVQPLEPLAPSMSSAAVSAAQQRQVRVCRQRLGGEQPVDRAQALEAVLEPQPKRRPCSPRSGRAASCRSPRPRGAAPRPPARGAGAPGRCRGGSPATAPVFPRTAASRSSPRSADAAATSTRCRPWSTTARRAPSSTRVRRAGEAVGAGTGSGTRSGPTATAR